MSKLGETLSCKNPRCSNKFVKNRPNKEYCNAWCQHEDNKRRYIARKRAAKRAEAHKGENP